MLSHTAETPLPEKRSGGRRFLLRVLLALAVLGILGACVALALLWEHSEPLLRARVQPEIWAYPGAAPGGRHDVDRLIAREYSTSHELDDVVTHYDRAFQANLSNSQGGMVIGTGLLSDRRTECTYSGINGPQGLRIALLTRAVNGRSIAALMAENGANTQILLVADNVTPRTPPPAGAPMTLTRPAAISPADWQPPASSNVASFGGGSANGSLFVSDQSFARVRRFFMERLGRPALEGQQSGTWLTDYDFCYVVANVREDPVKKQTHSVVVVYDR